MRFLLALSGSLVAWKFLADLGLGDTLYVPRNLVLSLGLVLLARRVGIDRDELGLLRRHLGPGLGWGAASAAVIAAAIGLGVAIADAVEPVALLLADDRADLGASALVFAVLVRIPLGTALFEEVAFRGVLRAAARRVLSPVAATAWSSVLFGLWHIPPTAVALRINDVDPWSTAGLWTITGAVTTTAVAGVLFDQLRARSGSLVAPWAAHWAFNALGLAAAAATR